MMIQNKKLRTYSVVLHELTEHVVQVEASSIEEASYNAEDGWKEGLYCDENATLLKLTTVRSKRINEEKA